MLGVDATAARAAAIPTAGPSTTASLSSVIAVIVCGIAPLIVFDLRLLELLCLLQTQLVWEGAG